MRALLTAVLLAGGLVAPVLVSAQGRGGPPPAPTARASAPIDLTGQWVSLVNEDWRFRMVTPPKGDFASLNLNAEGRASATPGIRRQTSPPASSAGPTAPSA